MRTQHIAPAVLAATALLALTGCQDAKPAGAGPAAIGSGTARPVSPPATTGAPAAAPAPAKAGTLPDLVGKGLQAAQDAAQAAGFSRLTSHDSLGRERAQVFDRNWKVCSQTPAPGPAAADVRVDFGAVQLEESCPASDPGPQPEARGTMPEFGGKSVKAVRAALPSNTSFTIKDGREGRMVLQESNWQVCAQVPKAGTPLDGRPVELIVVKFGETCP
ncbi:hypothetical protein [Streptomyces sp. NPDC029003]|uniref:hypothetical protein n=1 Tax=Streptomyces sp. NPDC029003 TaxID=3155125 RepID=UPI0033C8C79D